MKFIGDVMIAFLAFSVLIWGSLFAADLVVLPLAAAPTSDPLDVTIFQGEWLAWADPIIQDEFHEMEFDWGVSVRSEVASMYVYEAITGDWVGYDDDGLGLECDEDGTCEGDD